MYTATTETKHKKTSPTELDKLKKLEKKVYDILDHSVTLLSNPFIPLQQKFSPKVSVMQNILNVYPEKKYEERHLGNC